MSQELIEHLRAGFPVFWITTSEPDRVKTTVTKEVSEYQFKDGTKAQVLEWSSIKNQKPTDPLMQITEGIEGRTVLFLYNYHWFIKQPNVIQTIQELFPIWANQGKAIVIVAPITDIPVELEKDITLIDLPLPKEDEISEILVKNMPDNNGFKQPKGDALKRIIANSKGLTRRELQNVYNLSLVKTGNFDPIVINDYRSQVVKKSGLATVLKPDVTLQDHIGYDVPKKFVMSTINNPEAKGVIFVGPPGVGKTMLVKAFCHASGKLGIMVHTGALFSKYQGETDKNVKALIDLAWSLGDSYFILDEIEKSFAGVGGSGDLDSGVTSRALSQFLDFFQNRPPGCYIGATSNDITKLPPEYTRAGRWDTAPIYMGLPNKVVRNQIMQHYIKKFGLTKEQTKKHPDTAKWTGGEIETLCHNAKMLDCNLSEAAQYVKPQYITMGDRIQALEAWAKDTCINADTWKDLKVVDKKRKIDV